MRYEFRTSKVDYRDDSVLQLMATRAKPRFGLRGLLFNPVEQRFVSRDLNAALNIRRIHLGFFILSRSAADGRLEQSIVKRLKDR